MSVRVNVYVDAFNLYYGALRGTPFRWLDLAALARALLRPGDELGRIRYFTALVAARPDDPGQPQRQQTYLRALRTLPELSIHLGQYRTHPVRMALADPPARGPRTALVLRTEEKGSDVNLATYLLLDAFHRDAELAVVVSNDSDLVEPIAVTQRELGIAVGIWNPYRRPSNDLIAIGPRFFKTIRAGALARSQFAPLLIDPHGEIRRPQRWASGS